MRILTGDLGEESNGECRLGWLCGERIVKWLGRPLPPLLFVVDMKSNFNDKGDGRRGRGDLSILITLFVWMYSINKPNFEHLFFKNREKFYPPKNN